MTVRSKNLIDTGIELLDVCDEHGRPTGEVKPRPLVHRDGDWHRSFHCWVLTMGPGGHTLIVLQRRSLEKATWRGLWDVSVAGHYSTGEDVSAGVREIREELGLEVDPSELVQVARRREEVHYENGIVEREIQDVCFLRRDFALVELHPDPREVIEVALVGPRELVLLSERPEQRLDAPGGRVGVDGTLEPQVVELRFDEMVPRAGRYYQKVARFAKRLARGDLSRRETGVRSRGSAARRPWW